MTSGLLITALMPSITSSGIFSSRRANSGADAFAANNPLIGAMNLDIAGGQVLNAAKGVSNIAKESKGEIAKDIVSAEKSIKAARPRGGILPPRPRFPYCIYLANTPASHSFSYTALAIK